MQVRQVFAAYLTRVRERLLKESRCVHYVAVVQGMLRTVLYVESQVASNVAVCDGGCAVARIEVW